MGTRLRGGGSPPPRSPPPMVISPRSSPRGEPGGKPAPGQFSPAYPSGKSSPALLLARLPAAYRHDCPRPREEAAGRAGWGSGGERSVGDGMKARCGLLFWNRCTRLVRPCGPDPVGCPHLDDILQDECDVVFGKPFPGEGPPDRCIDILRLDELERLCSLDRCCERFSRESEIRKRLCSDLGSESEMK